MLSPAQDGEKVIIKVTAKDGKKRPPLSSLTFKLDSCPAVQISTTPTDEYQDGTESLVDWTYNIDSFSQSHAGTYVATLTNDAGTMETAELTLEFGGYMQ